MAQEESTHIVSESWQCCVCLKRMIHERDRISVDCGETLCPECLLQCEVIKTEAKVTCGGCCSEMRKSQECPTSQFSPGEISIEDMLPSTSRQVRCVVEQALGIFSQFIVDSGIIVQPICSADQAYGKLVSELYPLYGPLPLYLPSKMEAKWEDLAMTQRAVVRAAYDCLLWDCCRIAENRNKCGSEVCSKLIKAVDERNQALSALLDALTDIRRKESETVKSLLKVIRKGRAVNFAKNRRRFEVQKKLCDWQRDLCPYPTQPTATGWAGNLTDGV